MEITGKIIVALEPVGGVSAKGNSWKKREYVLETQETYPKKVAFNFFNERVDQFPLQVGQVIKLSFDIDSREYNGRWYVECRGWKAEEVSAQQPAAFAPQAPAADPFGPAPQMPGGYQTPAAPPAPDLAPSPTDNLPF